MVTARQRQELGELMDWAFSERHRFSYPPGDKRVVSVAGIASVADFKAFVLSGRAEIDCSQMVYALWGAIFGGVRDQDGATGSMLADPDYLPHYNDPASAYTGAGVVLGPGTGEHACMVRHRDAVHGDPLVFSHGGDDTFAARFVPLSVEQASHERPTTMLSIAHL
jgi:hypothetical protein